MTDTLTSSCSILPYGEDLLAHAAARILADHAEVLPDLAKVAVVLPSSVAAPQLRRQLLIQAAQLGHEALLAPHLLTLDEWLARFPLLNPVMGQHGRELLLVESLREHPGLLGSGSLWSVADALLELFDELTLNEVGLPENLTQFRQRIARAYGTAQLHHHGLEMETTLVYTLWHAWHQQLRESSQIDSATAMVLRLRANLETPPETHLYLLAPDIESRAEREWLRSLLRQNRAVLILQGELSIDSDGKEYLPDGWLRDTVDGLGVTIQPPTDMHPYKEMLHTLYDHTVQPLHKRASEFVARHPTSPLPEQLDLYAATSAEEEARAVETQVRLWLLQGKQQIGIVTENRRLARRVRALLERAGVVLDDAAGWALSTTSAAAVVERWLECVEEDFPWRPLLDLLKSPFFATAVERAAHLESVYRLEQQIIHNDNVGSGLQRYRNRIIERQQLLAGKVDDATSLLQLLDRLEQAAQWLTYCRSGDEISAERIVDLLEASLRELGLGAALRADAAGTRLLDELQQMRAAAASGQHRMTWPEFRGWLGRTLERYNFRPAASHQCVRLMSLAQSGLHHFDGLVLAGAEQEYLPGNGGSSPFFNDQVRRDLGLPTRDQRLGKRFHLYRHLLEAAPSILVTLRREERGEEIPPSPWLELLVAFHRLAWHSEPGALALRQIVDNPASEVARRDAPLPLVTGMPCPSLPDSLLPQRISASAYQQLIDCPYRFFAARGLQLSPPETIREALEKVDYGEKIHRCLQAFHDGVADLPGPFSKPLSPSNREEAIALLESIAEAEFLHGLGTRFENRGWLNRWRQLIPLYIDWQMERQQQWQVARHEAQFLRDDQCDNIALQGRLDRLDKGVDGYAVVDYKTGRVAGRDEVMAGESVQLPFYALLADHAENPVIQVELLRLDEGRVSSPLVLEGDELHQLKKAHLARIDTLFNQLRSGLALPAWGDEETCARCDMDGLCRRQVWPL